MVLVLVVLVLMMMFISACAHLKGLHEVSHV